jgi:uncharacterized protein
VSDVPATPSPWHAGEVQMQRSAGMAERMAGSPRLAIRDSMPDQHRQFYAQLPFAVLAATNAEDEVWATVLYGDPGFASSPDPKVLQLSVSALDPWDPVLATLNDGSASALLGIELDTRRRNRVNGTVFARSDGGFSIRVEQAFGNCPQYIQARTPHFVRSSSVRLATPAQTKPALDERAHTLIARADTFFVSSFVTDEHGKRHVDVSHRGGRSGFVRVDADGSLTIPDFAGNLYFNTLGNFLVNPKAGLLFVDFETGDTLQLTGSVTIQFSANAEEPEMCFKGAQRFWRFFPKKVIFRAGLAELRWTLPENAWSPHTLRTGTW